MVYKKFKVINGKRYGPYLYENKRVGERVITNYLGKSEDLISKKSYSIYLIAGAMLIVLLILAFLLYLNFSPTGNAVLDVKNTYNLGEKISGQMKLSLSQGELLPSDSIVEVNLGSQSKQFILSDLVTIPMLLVFRSYYGLKTMWFLLLTLTVCIFITALVLDYSFAALHWLPKPQTGGMQVISSAFKWDWQAWLSLIFIPASIWFFILGK